MDDQQNNNSAFVRQRRNLMVVSLLLLFSEISGLKVTEINVFGTKLLINNPHAITALLWIATIYWAIRYYQYSREYHGRLGQAVGLYMQRHAEPLILTQWKRENPNLVVPMFDRDGNRNFGFTLFGIMEHRFRFSNNDIRFRLDHHRENPNSLPANGSEYIVRLAGMPLFWLRIRGWTDAIVNTTIFTDWIVPYMVLSFPILYAVYKVV
ncbi:MAG TPA: hypothetical protein VKC56_07235 [Gallionellaceae bacterium]|nr:hypothetical protein [Gallionellaceae bacterium]